jgi:hypothetical protein
LSVLTHGGWLPQRDERGRQGRVGEGERVRRKEGKREGGKKKRERERD